MTTIQLAEAPTSLRAIQSRLLPPQPRCRLIQHSLKAGASFERHASASPASVQTLFGEGSLQSEGRAAALKAGVMVHLRPGQSSRLSADTDLVVVVSEYLSPGMPC
jgi:quercetin dioxygenase-like cupin family protein